MDRRRAIGVVAVFVGGVTLFATVWGRRATARLRAVSHQPLPPDTSALDRTVAQRVSLLAGALFGHRLDEDEVTEVGDGLQQLLALDGGWRAEFARAATWLDRRARAHGAQSLGDASDEARDSIVDEIMREPVLSWRSRLRATVDADERTRRRMRSELVGALAAMYVGSAVSWRRRGYARRPGDPGDPREYTRAGVVRAC